MSIKYSDRIGREHLKRCKESSAEAKLNWLAAAVEFVQECAENKEINHNPE
tara:strand:+ start:348 stop:500 length:153 start_codon:yes stop_codon:yes gene_type:complete